MVKTIKKAFRSLVVVGLLAFPFELWGQATAQGAFFVTVSDLPLMPGLAEQIQSVLVFDNPSGRIIEVSAAGLPTADSILAFYGQTLPQLGWREVAEDRFEREGEVLRLVFTQVISPTVVMFTIAPILTSAP